MAERTVEQDKEEVEFLDGIIEQALRLFLEKNIDDMKSEIVKIVMRNFPIRSFLLLMRDKESGTFIPSKIIGYPEDRAPLIRQEVAYTVEEIRSTLDTAKVLGKFSRLYEAEDYPDVTDKDLTETLTPDLANMKRDHADSWHPLDRAVFCFVDRAGNEIGYIYVTSTANDRVLAQSSIDGLNVLASLGSVALEVADLKSEEQVLLEKHEIRMMQISQIMTVSSDILTLTDASKLIQKVLELIERLFDFKSSAIILWDETEKCFRWIAFRGYSDKQVARGIEMRMSKDVIDRNSMPEYRVGLLTYFKPAEKALAEDLQYFFALEPEEENSYLNKPREKPDSWHELDNMFFVIQDRAGKAIGALCVDEPSNGKIPSRETIEMVEIFVSLVAIALENAGLYADATRARDEVHVLNRLMFHDLMNYSMAIRGYLDLAASQPDDPGTERYIDRAMNQIDVTAELIDKVKKLSAIRSAEKKNMLRIDLARTIMNQATKTAGIFPSKRVKFAFNFETEDAFVMANDLLPDIFHNIFMNAIKMDMHETVMIDVGLKDLSEARGESRSRSWAVSVADHGPGIPDERKRAIFLGAQKLLSTEPARGMGLGLSIVKSLLDLYGGEVWVEDREQGHPEKGSVFLVRMPAA
jgi:signal transduction histidine kinase